MSKQYWRAANLLNPVPVVLVSCCDGEGHDNVMTAAWAGTVCSDPVMVSVSIRKNRYSHDMIVKSGEFVINLVNQDLVKATDYVGIYSGKKIDKFALEGDLKLTREPSKMVKAPSIQESPLTLECKVHSILELGSHDMFIGEVVATGVDDRLVDENNRLDLHKADLVAYSHGEYRALGKLIGTFGYSAKKQGKQESKSSVKKQRRAIAKANAQDEKKEKHDVKEDKIKRHHPDKEEHRKSIRKGYETKKTSHGNRDSFGKKDDFTKKSNKSFSSQRRKDEFGKKEVKGSRFKKFVETPTNAKRNDNKTFRFTQKAGKRNMKKTYGE